MASVNATKTPSKAKQVLLKVFGDPKSGIFCDEFPAQRDVATFWMYLDENEIGFKKGAKNAKDNNNIFNQIATALIKKWEQVDPNMIQAKEPTIVQRVRDFINKKVKPLKKYTDRLKESENNNQWLSKKKIEFLSIFDLTPDEGDENENEVI